MSELQKLVIIDGKSVFYRGYYAMGNLSRSDGTPTSGVYGFAVIAMEIVKQLNPTKVIVAWDKAHTSTAKRTAIFQDYKAGRVKPPEDFYAQIPVLRKLIDDLCWNFYECDEYEADDIIGTLALQADNDFDENGVCKWMTYIVSSDLDMLQIVDENTRMYRLLKGFSDLEELDVPAVEEKYGIKKIQFLDMKALKGDNSDNIPGVPGIGEKTAVKLLNDYGTLDGIYEHIDEIKGSTQTKLIAGKDSAYMSYKLAKIMTDAPVSLADAIELKVDGPRIIKSLKELEFYSLVRRFAEFLQSGDENSVDTLEDVDEEVTDDETDIDVPENIEIPSDLILLDDVKTEMHNDAEIAQKVLSGEKYWDLDQADFLLNPLQRKDKTEQMSLMDEVRTDEDRKKDYVKQVKDFYRYEKLRAIYEEFDLPLIPILFKMEQEGVLLDLDYFTKLNIEFTEEVEKLEQKICSVAGVEFNVNSPVQLSQVLFEKLLLPTNGIKKTSRGYSTGVKELDKLKNEHEIIPLIMKYREMAKLLSTYIRPLPELADKNGRIHTTFTQNVTATGRLSSLNPNLQNIPVRSEEGKRIREGMVAAPGKVFVAADYAQFELRLAAVMSGDQNLISDFNSGVDIHTKTAAEVFGISMDEVTKTQRRAAKVINFGVMYGMSVKGLTDATGMNYGEAKAFIDQYFEVRKPIKNYLENMLEQARTKGYVETYYGRRRPTPDVNSSNRIVKAAAERAAQNMPIQGTEADLMKRAMIAVNKELPEGAKMILQIHDSLVVECDENLAEEVANILKEKMENVAPELEIKLAVDVKQGSNLAEV